MLNYQEERRKTFRALASLPYVGNILTMHKYLIPPHYKKNQSGFLIFLFFGSLLCYICPRFDFSYLIKGVAVHFINLMHALECSL